MSEAPRYLPTLAARRDPLADPRAQLARLDALPAIPTFASALEASGLPPLRARAIEVLQINVGKVCNQTCRHCHVDAGPDRTETMSRATLERCLEIVAREPAIRTVDVTGGAPELHPDFRWLVRAARALGRHVMLRCNLTVLETPSHRDLPELLAAEGVEIVASLPHYARLSTDRQRGEGVHERSIRALQRLCAIGYGDARSGLRLVLVTNPVGAFLPGEQAALEREWKREMKARYGIAIDALYTITNMPISRYLEWLERSGNLERYMGELVRRWNPATVPGLMCRTTLSVGWDGALYDCDFNQMLELPIARGHVDSFDAATFATREVVTARHCFGCTAGGGSSCGGATA